MREYDIVKRNATGSIKFLTNEAGRELHCITTTYWVRD